MVSPGTTSRTEPASSAVAAGDLHYQRIAVYALLAVTVLRLLWLVGNPINLYPDEAQYWLWSRSLAFGYFSKPPLLPWIIALTTPILVEDEFRIPVASPFPLLPRPLPFYSLPPRHY